MSASTFGSRGRDAKGQWNAAVVGLHPTALITFLNCSVVRNTRNPVYEEDFTFYGLTMNELQSMSLHFVVLSFDRYSRDDVIGEVVCPFTTIELHQIENQQVALSREIQPRSLKVSEGSARFIRLSSTFCSSLPLRSNRKDVESFSSHCAGNLQPPD
jgi:C2 domain